MSTERSATLVRSKNMSPMLNIFRKNTRMSVVFISSASSWRCSTIEIFLVRNGMVAVVNESSSGWTYLPKVEVGSSFRLSRGLRQPVEQSSHSKKGSEQNSAGSHVTLPVWSFR